MLYILPFGQRFPAFYTFRFILITNFRNPGLVTFIPTAHVWFPAFLVSSTRESIFLQKVRRKVVLVDSIIYICRVLSVIPMYIFRVSICIYSLRDIRVMNIW